jgi:hypothetical protein
MNVLNSQRPRSTKLQLGMTFRRSNLLRLNAPEHAYAFAKGEISLQIRVDAFLSQIKEDGRLLRLAKMNNLEPIVLLK